MSRNRTLIDNAEDLDTVMSMNNLLKYSDNYSMTSRNLWNYYRDEIDDVGTNDNASDGKSFEYKTNIVGKTPEIQLQLGNPEDADQPARQPVPILHLAVTIPLKYFNNF